ncbi:hypothetical protein LguiA_030160 [Lonicera macranthoides]
MLDKRSRKKCYMLPSRELSIAWKDDESYWNWPSIPGSRIKVLNSKLTYIKCTVNFVGSSIFIITSETRSSSLSSLESSSSSSEGFNKTFISCLRKPLSVISLIFFLVQHLLA